ncbi:UNVERIFIED_CONTAM: hypothetical protein HDU68_005983 [Siphonaria sp. JEL0065]|nr:hypothetical protein HDU68_005983 [Siphonaria sp. JEL0065]
MKTTGSPPAGKARPTNNHSSNQNSSATAKNCKTHGPGHGDLDCFNPNTDHKAWLITQGYKEECPKCKAANLTNKQIQFKHFEQSCRNKNRQGTGPTVVLKYAGLEFGNEYWVTKDAEETEEEEGGSQQQMTGEFFV